MPGASSRGSRLSTALRAARSPRAATSRSARAGLVASAQPVPDPASARIEKLADVVAPAARPPRVVARAISSSRVSQAPAAVTPAGSRRITPATRPALVAGSAAAVAWSWRPAPGEAGGGARAAAGGGGGRRGGGGGGGGAPGGAGGGGPPPGPPGPPPGRGPHGVGLGGVHGGR